MQALSIRQPWAWLITHGHKDIENRTWHTACRGPVLIHTGQRLDDDADYARDLASEIGVAMPQDLPLGGIVGMARIIDCVTYADSPWFCGTYGFVLADARPLPFVACPGRRKVFQVNPSILSRTNPRARGSSAMPLFDTNAKP